MQGDGLWLQQLQASDIADQGSMVTLSDGKSTAPALFISDPKDFQKYLPADAAPLGRGKQNVLFVFDGTMFGKVNAADTLTFQGTNYEVNSPTHPQWEQGICTMLPVLAFIP